MLLCVRKLISIQNHSLQLGAILNQAILVCSTFQAIMWLMLAFQLIIVVPEVLVLQGGLMLDPRVLLLQLYLMSLPNVLALQVQLMLFHKVQALQYRLKLVPKVLCPIGHPTVDGQFASV